MARPLNLTRDEAEMLVDLCEATHDKRLWWLAEELRKQWGMVPPILDENGAPVIADLSDIGIKNK